MRTLEPRIVLNATAELIPLGDLLIFGDAADDLVDVKLDASGRIEIFDANSAVIPIRVGTDASGNPILVDSIHPNQIGSGRLSVNLGGGDDTLSVEVPEGLSVTVVDDVGDDSVALTLRGGVDGVADETLRIDAETISINVGGDSLDLASSELRAAGTSGSITIDNVDSLRLGDVSVDSGELRLGSDTDPVTGDISQFDGTDVDVERLRVDSLGGVELSQTENVIRHIDQIRSGDDVNIASDVTGTSDATMLVDRIETLSGIERGDIVLRVDGSMRLISSDLASDTILSTDNGQISLTATQRIELVDSVANNNTFTDSTNHEIIAGGDHGRVLLTAGGVFEAGDDVQIHASQTTSGAVTVDASDVVLGQDFEINTGDGIGIARRFTPRPELEVIAPAIVRPLLPGVITDPNDPDYVPLETAFYDVASIRTNILTQANQNDASGILSVEIGTEGENGLTLAIDWGAETNRLQRIENLPGGRTRVDVSHVYTESDILNSTLNGRRSATDPLAVRFSVSHHDSIVITGDSIEQAVAPEQVATAGGMSLREDVPGRLLSSTDNPQTGPLESGRAFFVIPRIDVPLAFFPVRNVIPEPIDPPPPVILTSTIELNYVSFDTVQASVSPTAIREEFFQLRTLSPDPQGDDLMEPIRLPDNVMSEDQLKELFAELPDGGYEIQYVIGDSDQRTILRVDLRGGKAVISGDEVSPGSLLLEVIEDDGSLSRSVDLQETGEKPVLREVEREE